METSIFSTPQQPAAGAQSRHLKKLQQQPMSLLKTPAAIVRARGLKDITNRTPAAATVTKNLLLNNNNNNTTVKKKLVAPSTLKKSSIVVHPDAAEVKLEEDEDVEVEYCPPSVDWTIVDKSSLVDELGPVDVRRVLASCGRQPSPAYLKQESQAEQDINVLEMMKSLKLTEDDADSSFVKISFDSDEEAGESIIFNDITSLDDLPLDDLE